MMAETQQKALWKRAASDAARLALADQFHEKGNFAVASRLYVRLANSRQTNDSTEAAKERLTKLAKEARQKLAEIDALLTRDTPTVSPGEALDGRDAGDIDPRTLQWEQRIVAAFEQYDKLADDYRGVPKAEGQIKAHAAKQRRRAELAAVLNEPEAKTLLDAATQHEAEGHACCAYWVYKDAARLVPAPSGQIAKERLDKIQDDPKLIAAAKACRDLQECHKKYARAEKLLPDRPERARELFAQIVQSAPAESEVCRAARGHLEDLR